MKKTKSLYHGHRQERAPPGRARIEWKLITNLPVRSRAEAIEKLDWCAMRWKIETFHKILKSGCRAEESSLRMADRLTNLISIFCIPSWRIFSLTMLSRSAPRATAELAFTQTEIELLERVVHDTPRNAQAPPLLRNVIRLAQLDGYLARQLSIELNMEPLPWHEARDNKRTTAAGVAFLRQSR